MLRNVVVIGSSGAIGEAFVKAFSGNDQVLIVHAFSCAQPEKIIPNVLYHKMNDREEASIARAAVIASEQDSIDLLIIATGVLHHGDMMPEKSLKDLSVDKFQYFFQANAVFPALVLKHFCPKLRQKDRAVVVSLSARVGSISDNRLGGWYSYRASKAALNMIIKNSAVEISRTHPRAIVAGLHPGTVDSRLSQPFQRNIPRERLFSPEFAVKKLMNVVQNLTTEDSGKCFGWDGVEIYL